MNGIRKLAFHAARYNRQKYLDSDVRSRPLQSVRRAFFSYRTVVILHRERPCLGSRSGGVFKLSIAVLRRGFFPSPDGSELCFCPTNLGLSDKNARSARPGSLLSRDPFLSYLWIPTEKQLSEMLRSRKLRVISTLSGSMKSKISASTNCSAKPDWSITAAVLSSKESSARSSSSSDATLRRHNSSHG